MIEEFVAEQDSFGIIQFVVAMRNANNQLHMNGKLFPTIIIILMVCAAVVYLCTGNVKSGIFWLSLAVANTCVVY